MDCREIKTYLKTYCQEHIDQRMLRIQKTIADIQESLSSETKSSAGDKHETGRAMLQLEREKAGTQLAEIEKLQEALHKVDTSKTYQTVGLGSIVNCSTATYFISISVGKIDCNSQIYYAIAPNTPMGKLLLGKKVKDSIVFNGNEIVIEEIF
ncbi:3-oxoacyl-ACP synthase [Aquimarina brevivitae]|uniref:3-oxoacyl-ACP synthase n=1 Tax=Aquimarina brevivitae TaxID=323412 RepID=UPI0030FEE417